MTEECAHRIYDILVDHCRARESDRADFIYHATHDCREYRLQGCLGFGGKCYIERRGVRVSCYPEDETSDRVARISKANAALKMIDKTQ